MLQRAHGEERPARRHHAAAAAQPVARRGLRAAGGPDLSADRLTAAEIYAVARHVGFSPDAALTFTAIGLAESGGDRFAWAKDGESSKGIWQVNEAVHGNRWGDLFDPVVNARAAYELSQGGQVIQPWSVTHAKHRGTTRDYRSYLDEARDGAEQAGESPGLPAADWATVSTGPPSPSSGLVHPVAGATYTNDWGAPRSGGRSHEGTDVFAPRGTEIRAMTGGRVVKGFWNDTGGNVVRVEGDDGRYYYYAHLDTVSSDLQVGQRVQAGQVIGTVGDTGNAKGTPPHLHLGIQADGEWVNPYPILKQAEEGASAAAVYEPDAPPVVPDSPDTDQDGLTDAFEQMLGTDVERPDGDDDGLSDLYETTVSHTDPTKADGDDDGRSDALEVAEGTDAGRAVLPEQAVRAGFGGAATADADADGLSDLYELERGLDRLHEDSDRDGLSDALEVALGSNPSSNDGDRDGITDKAEHDAGSLEPVGAVEPEVCTTCGMPDPCACGASGGGGADPCQHGLPPASDDPSLSDWPPDDPLAEAG